MDNLLQNILEILCFPGEHGPDAVFDLVHQLECLRDDVDAGTEWDAEDMRRVIMLIAERLEEDF